MSFGLLLPLGLTALAAWILPLLIHLIRRPTDHVVVFPALRWISAVVRPRRRPRFDDPFLLLLRLLLLAAIAVLIAQPFVAGVWHSPRTWVLVSSEAEFADPLSQTLERDAQWRWIAPGFPSIDTPRPHAGQPLASLLREFDAGLDTRDTLVAVVPQLLSGLDGERLQLIHDIKWRVVGTRALEAPPEASPQPTHVALRHTADARDALRYLHAAVAAWNATDATSHLVDEQLQDAAISAQTQWLIWTDGRLSNAAEHWVAQGGVALVVDPADATGLPLWRNAAGDVLARAKSIGEGRVIVLQKVLDPAVFPELLDPAFPMQLRQMLVTRKPALDLAPAESMIPLKRDQTPTARAEALAPALVILIAALFLLERMVATRRRIGA